LSRSTLPLSMPKCDRSRHRPQHQQRKSHQALSAGAGAAGKGPHGKGSQSRWTVWTRRLERAATMQVLPFQLAAYARIGRDEIAFREKQQHDTFAPTTPTLRQYSRTWRSEPESIVCSMGTIMSPSARQLHIPEQVTRAFTTNAGLLFHRAAGCCRIALPFSRSRGARVRFRSHVSSRPVDLGKIARAVECFGGRLVIEWQDEKRPPR
jgi:hypothetical protein